MLARIAENLYWLSRYLERAESTARIINEHSNMLMDLPSADAQSSWYPLVAITGVDELFWKHYKESTEENVTFFLIADIRNPSSIVSALNAVRYNLRSSRNTMPTKLFENINNLYLLAQTAKNINNKPGPRQRFLSAIELQCLAITGLIEGGMRHDLNYLFMRLGCHIERADMTSRILDVRSANLLASTEGNTLLFDNHQWVSVLRSLSAFQIYISNTHRPVSGPHVLSYLLKDEQLPRAYRCCLLEIRKCLDSLEDSANAQDKLTELSNKLSSIQVQELINEKSLLHTYLDELQVYLAHVHTAIAELYFPPKS